MRSEGGDFLGGDFLGDGTTPTRGRPIRLGSRLDLQTGTLREASCDGNDPQWKIEGVSGRLVVAMCATIHGGMETSDPDEARLADLKQLAEGRSNGSLRKANEAQWKSLWSQAFDVTPLPLQYRQIVLAQQYYLLTSYNASPWPTGPQGVAGNNWKGQQLWDNRSLDLSRLASPMAGLCRRHLGSSLGSIAGRAQKCRKRRLGRLVRPLAVHFRDK